MKLVSVVTPTYNRADLLPKTIESILRQTYENFEYLIIDDGSQDNTKEIVLPYLKDRRVKYVYQDNQGEPAAVNNGWNMAKGEYFVQVNSDDPAYENLLEEMVKAMDKNPEAIVAYCNFDFIDENEKVFNTTKSPDWDFLYQLSNYSCVAAAPGTFFRKTGPLSKWEKIRRNNYRHINDIEMYWDMALEGDFIHVNKTLCTWRQHPGQISYARYESIYEIFRWFNYYFSKPNLPQKVLDCCEKTKNSIIDYSLQLLDQSSLSDAEKLEKKFDIQQKYFTGSCQYSNLQIGDNDLVGNKFNGHDLHFHLENNNINSWHIVRQKHSEDEKTIVIPSDESTNFANQILNRKEFVFSDIVHMHLIHNTDFDIKLLPLITKLKPTVLTLHDPYFMGGHCIYSLDCDKWKSYCSNCPYPDTHFKLEKEDSSLQFAVKETYFQNSDINLIVASDWMEDRVKQSPILKGKKVYKLPFGINQNIFKPKDQDSVKQELNIPQEDFVLFFRIDKGQFKGRDVLYNSLDLLKDKNLKITILTVGEANLLTKYRKNFNIIDFGWLKDDEKLAKLYQAADLFLMPSKAEAFGMMAIEAMSCKKTVIALENTSLKSVINAPECGVVANVNDYPKVLLELINSPKELLKRNENSYEFAKNNYSIEKYIDGMLDIYSDIIKNFSHTPQKNAVLNDLYNSAPKELHNKKEHNWIFNNVSEFDSPNFNHINTKKFTAFNSLTWKIMKPFRVIAYMVTTILIAPFNYIKNVYNLIFNEVPVEDEKVFNSLIWKITSPFRKMHSNVLRKD